MRPLVLNNEIVKKKIKGILVISGCGNSGLVNKESMQIRNKDFIFHMSIGAIRSGLLHKFFQNDHQKIKETSHLVLGSSVIKLKKRILDRCEGSLPRGLVIKKHSLQFKAHVTKNIPAVQGKEYSWGR